MEWNGTEVRNFKQNSRGFYNFYFMFSLNLSNKMELENSSLIFAECGWKWNSPPHPALPSKPVWYCKSPHSWHIHTDKPQGNSDFPCACGSTAQGSRTAHFKRFISDLSTVLCIRTNESTKQRCWRKLKMFLGFQRMQNNKPLVPGSMGISFVIIKYYKPIDNISIFLHGNSRR